MEPLWWSHLAAPLCISSLLSVNYTWFTRCLRQRRCGASIWERVITPGERVAVGGGGVEGGGIYHSPTWQDVLQLSLVELEWAIALIALIRDDLCQVCRESRREWRAQEKRIYSRAIVLFVQVGLIAHHTAPFFRSLLTQMVCIHPRPYMNTIKPAE